MMMTSRWASTIRALRMVVIALCGPEANALPRELVSASCLVRAQFRHGALPEHRILFMVCAQKVA
jgi:hypothetical protein